ncbi:DUF3073 domain-containing protein [Leucobacter sp. NPDC058333]|uniref:DUF3073 domain-containing protein n=1 Tax=Leucobacter sp. NPDC058333 TaxID=3346450 RepID=UPI00365800F9
MGRGRQKAKHTKVARELKYFSPDTNYSALQQELSAAEAAEAAEASRTPEVDPWAEYASKYNAEDDDED